MDRVPEEILTRIIEHVLAQQGKQISNCAAVSYSWQHVVERITFRSLRLSVADLDKCHEIFRGQNVRRRGYLRSVNVQCIFRAPKTQGCCEVTRSVDYEDGAGIWTDFVKGVFAILKDMETSYRTQHDPVPAIELKFLESSRDIYAVRRHLQPTRAFCKSEQQEHTVREIESARRQPGSIRLHASDLPTLHHVSSFEGHGWGESKFLHPAWIGNVTSKLPELRELKLYMEDAYDWGSAWRRQYQLHLAESFTRIPPSNLETLHLKVFTHEIRNEDVPVQELVESAAGRHIYDSLIEHLATFRRLRTLTLTGPLTICPTISQINSDLTPHAIFPALEKFALEFTPNTADGRWFFLRDDAVFRHHQSNSSDDDEGESENEDEEESTGFIVYNRTPIREGEVSDHNKYRSLPNPQTMTPLLTSVARMCAQMPRIKQLSIKLNRNDMNRSRLDVDVVDRVFELWFLAASSTLEKFDNVVQNPVIPLDADISQCNRVYFRMGRYKPDAEVLKLWRETVGVDGKIIFLDEAHCEFFQPWGWFRLQYTGNKLHEM
ncbi:hypothetical protein GQ44DRAFT_700529 [Phaeosphaeriaceae sp. PMI808]|nr:hypothetical protein GQ44DRAFT_700529 [Phaeosphaeriaceae sp. PMI808]